MLHYSLLEDRISKNGLTGGLSTGFLDFAVEKMFTLKKLFYSKIKVQYCNLNSTLPAETEHKIPITSPKVILVTINSFKKLGYVIFIFG